MHACLRKNAHTRTLVCVGAHTHAITHRLARSRICTHKHARTRRNARPAAHARAYSQVRTHACSCRCSHEQMCTHKHVFTHAVSGQKAVRQYTLFDGSISSYLLLCQLSSDWVACCSSITQFLLLVSHSL